MPRGPKKGVPKPRIRRKAEDAQAAILDAAEKRLNAVGPGGIRLQDVAKDVGVSHPTVLHHFGSREGLVRAVVERSFERLNADVRAALAGSPEGSQSTAALLERVSAALASPSRARSLAWLALSDAGLPPDVGRLSDVIQALHARRTLLRGRHQKSPPEMEDTVFAVLLTAFALGGEALIGRALYPSAGRADVEQASAEFRAWFGKMLFEYLHR
jgi:AcrR family transcriptional regulator